jgi:hypothetical protein
LNYTDIWVQHGPTVHVNVAYFYFLYASHFHGGGGGGSNSNLDLANQLANLNSFSSINVK